MAWSERASRGWEIRRPADRPNGGWNRAPGDTFGGGGRQPYPGPETVRPRRRLGIKAS